ncbi:PfkB family carbohydrate kinase [Methylobacterium nonmethylotrophicum]|uniref:Ribokinase n=1 Tax=Methylobacterium nonmethylotrophicum TaxID=1141884 RepID=A0A4Z0NY96_9HYPH|nr:PfkB family carbohydrate kinase [Methylobacterium nonmethylotrophicum]TGE02454.1 ribokinase [Methylobacterium nonmethylotrophicum]
MSVDMAASPALFVLGSFVAACSATVDRLPRAGESLQAQAFLLEPGGKGLNLAVGARRLGAAVDGLFGIGDDALSSLAEPALRRADLPVAMLHRFPGPTGAGIGFTDAAGENCLAVYPGANARLGPPEVRAAGGRIAAAALVLAQFEAGDEAVAEAFRIAHGAGVRTLLNPSPFRMPPPEILATTGILVVNAVEAAAFGAALGVPVPEGRGEPAAFDALAGALLARGPDLVVITRGADGALARPAGGPMLVQPAFQVAARDSLGAGDAFTAGLAVSLAEGRPLAESLRRAAACGACVVRREGVFDALPDRAALASMLAGAESSAVS